MGNKINFFRGEKEKYKSSYSVNLNDDIYFSTDSNEILLNGINFGNWKYISKEDYKNQEDNEYNRPLDVKAQNGFFNLGNYSSTHLEEDKLRDLCYTISPMYTGVDNLDYNFDGIVDIDDIALVVSIIMTEKDDPQVQKLLKKFNIDPNSDTWDKDLGTALAAAGKTVGDGGEINVLIITQIIDVIAGNAQGSTYLGDCIIFFQVEGVYDPITYELIGAKKISLGKTQVNENLQRAVSAQLNNAGIQAASSVLPSSNQLNFIPTHSSIAPAGYKFTKVSTGDSLDPLDASTYQIQIDPIYSTYYKLLYTLNFQNIDLSDNTTWINVIGDYELVDYLLDIDTLPSVGINFNFSDTTNFNNNSSYFKELQTSVSTKDITRVKYTTGDITIQFLVIPFNLVIPDNSNNTLNNKEACIILARIVGLPDTITEIPVYYWSIGVNTNSTTPLDEAFSRLLSYEFIPGDASSSIQGIS